MHIDFGEGYTLRQFYYGDAPHLAKHGNNPNIAQRMRNSFPSPYTIEHARAWLQHVKNNEANSRCAMAFNDRAIGEIGFVIQNDVHRFSAELGYWLSEEHWGKGIASKAVAWISQYAHKEAGIVRMFADVADYNKRSCRVLERNGFVREAVFRRNIFKGGQFHDQEVYGRVWD